MEFILFKQITKTKDHENDNINFAIMPRLYRQQCAGSIRYQ